MLSRGYPRLNFRLDLGVEVVVGVFGFPVAASHAEGVFYGAVGYPALGRLARRMSLRFSRWLEQYSDRQSWNACADA